MISNIFSSFLTDRWEQDVQKLATREGAEEGKHGRPAADTPRYSVGETNVRGKVESQLLIIQKKLADEVQKVLPTIARRAVDVQQAEVGFESRQAIDVTRSNLSALFESRRSSLEDAFYRKHKSEGAYNAYRNVHNVTIDPDHPKDQLNYLSFVFLMLTVETVLNALFWRQNLEGDLTGSLVLALFIAGANIAVGFVGGLIFAYRNLNSRLSALFGWSGLAGSVLLVAYINLQVLNIREQQPNQTDVGALQNTLVFLLGFGFAMFAAYKGYRFLGSYPGYRDSAESYLKACNDVATEEETLRTAVLKEVRGQEDLRNTSIRKVSDVLTAYVKTKGDLQTLDLSYRASVAHLNVVLERSVGAYRRTNVATKGAAVPSPTWFNDPVEQFDSDSLVLTNALTDLSTATVHAERTLEAMRTSTKVETSMLSELRSDFSGQRLTDLKSDADATGLKRFLDSLSDIGNQGLNKPNYK
jgi:hypothetical protein